MALTVALVSNYFQKYPISLLQIFCHKVKALNKEHGLGTVRSQGKEDAKLYFQIRRWNNNSVMDTRKINKSVYNMEYVRLSLRNQA